MSSSLSVLSAARAHGALRRDQWIRNPRTDLLSGLVVALALIPEAISFSIIAGVDPKVGLYASFSIAIIIAFSGGRPGMISAATGAMALVLVPLVEEYGIEYLFAATILAGILQVGLGYLGVGELMRFVPRTVMLGFVNALAILIFLAQVPHILLTDDASGGDRLLANGIAILVGLAIIYGLPRITGAVPAPLVAIVAITGAAMIWKIDLPMVGDMGELPDTLPFVALPDLPFAFETLAIIFPVAFTLALVGLLESLLTAQLLDDLTDTDSDKNTEARGQGVANVATGFLGGMAGCAMIGQSMINYRSGGRTRLSTLASGVFLLVLILGLGDLVAQIPMAALVAVMIMVSVGTFDWRSITPSAIKAHPITETVIMAATVAIVVITHNLAYGVAAGVVLSAVFFARHVSGLVKVTSVVDPDNVERLYAVTGELFFASTHDIVHSFDYDAVRVKRVEIDLTDARIWDTSAVAALDTVVSKFEQRGIHAELIGMNEHAERLHTRTSGQVTVGH
ncbi:SulP family inorganic anion transporter [Ilumatobacter sp.]|uniref:SulP family inorganic anion transporter n=1 Tax=Ilumatobacter sp. TaxID=1967498 RepID=UPI003AF82177